MIRNYTHHQNLTNLALPISPVNCNDHSFVSSPQRLQIHVGPWSFLGTFC